MLEGAFRGKKEQALGIVVQTSRRINARDAYVICQGSARWFTSGSAIVCELAQNMKGFIEKHEFCHAKDFPGYPLSLSSAAYCKQEGWQSRAGATAQGDLSPDVLKDKKRDPHQQTTGGCDFALPEQVRR